MRISSSRVALLAVIVSVSLWRSSPAAAQGAQCPTTGTIGDCYNSLLEAARKKVAGKAAAAATNEAATKATGAPPASAAPASITDFIPKTALALMTPGVTANGEALSYTANLPLAGSKVVRHVPGTVQFAFTANNPNVFAALLDSAPESRRAAIKTRLSNTFDELDDPEFRLGFNLETKHWGRNPLLLSSSLASLVAEAVSDPFAGLLSTIGRYDVAENRAANPDNTCSESNMFSRRLQCYNSASQTSIIAGATALAMAIADREFADSVTLKRNGFDKLPDLINNQRQFNIAFTYRPTDRAVGVATAGLRLKLEGGLGNLNGAVAECKDSGKLEIACFNRYVNNPGVQRALRNGIRFAFSLDIDRQQEYHSPYVSEDSATTFTIPAKWGGAAILGIGGYLGAGAEGPQSLRADFSVEGRWAEAGGIRTTNLWRVNLSFTQRLSDQLNAIMGLSWANKAEYLDKDLHRLRALLGVRYKLVQSSDK